MSWRRIFLTPVVFVVFVAVALACLASETAGRRSSWVNEEGDDE
jgi:hypothetical protein